MEKDHDVAREQVRHILTQPDFEIGPQQLVGKPKGDACGHERPEQSQAATGAGEVRDQGKRSREQKETLNHITEGGQSKGLRQDERSPDQGGQTDCDTRGPELGICAHEQSSLPF